MDRDLSRASTVVLEAWRIFTRTRIIAMFYILKCKIVRTCDSFHYSMTINLETVVIIVIIIIIITIIPRTELIIDFMFASLIVIMLGNNYK